MLLLTPGPPATELPKPSAAPAPGRQSTDRFLPPRYEEAEAPTGGVRIILRAPSLIVVAALSILQGYLWLGVIPSDSSHRALAVVTLLAALAALAVSRPLAPVRRSTLELSALVGPAVLAAASLLHPLRAGSPLRTGVGIGDLLVATVLVGLVAAAEWRRRAARPSAGSDEVLPTPSIPVA